MERGQVNGNFKYKTLFNVDKKNGTLMQIKEMNFFLIFAFLTQE